MTRSSSRPNVLTGSPPRSPGRALTAATNARLQAQANAQPGGIHQDELVFAAPRWRIINASFCHPHPLGSRFNGPDRGAWYAGQHVETSLAEVSYHRTVELAEIDRWELVADYQDYLSDIHAPMHDLRRPRDRRAREGLAPDSYTASQAMAETLLPAGSVGVAYPAVRDPGCSDSWRRRPNPRAARPLTSGPCRCGRVAP